MAAHLSATYVREATLQALWIKFDLGHTPPCIRDGSARDRALVYSVLVSIYVRQVQWMVSKVNSIQEKVKNLILEA